MGRMRHLRLKPFLVMSLAAVSLLFYQNCSNKESSFTAASTVTSQCSAKIQIETLKIMVTNNQLDCTNLVNYKCEIRNFGEGLINEVVQGETCILIEAKEVCVPTLVRNFNTSGARQVVGVNESDFLEGGEFNHQESNCSYFDTSKNMSFLRVESQTVSTALSDLVKKCSDAQLARN